MAFKIRPGFSQKAIDKYIADQTGKIEKAIIFRLKLVGEQFVTNARNNGDYKDETGNLRSSIGYVVCKNGTIIEDNFKQAGKGSDRSTGVAAGQHLAREIANDHPKGFVLICVAGMEYAAAVESKGYDVISNASANAKQDLIKAIQALSQKIKKL